jgi:1,4-dihydroxy-2-naphthoate polyprenyltransferase
VENQSQHPFILFIRLTRPLFLLGGALLYAMGVGIAHYLGVNIDWGLYILGQAWVTVLQLSTHFLNEYYNAPEDLDNKNRTPFTGGSGILGPGKLPRDTALYAALGSLAVLAMLTVLLISVKRLEPTTIMIMVLGFLGSFFYSTPPISLERTGYGELTASFIVAFLVPAFGYILQSGELHRLIAMVTFPLFVLHLAMLIAFDLPDYATDMKHDKRTLLVRIGWEKGLNLHNLLIVIAFFLVALAASFQLPLFIALPALIPLPLGFLQIWQMRRIASGVKPNWTAVTLNALATFAAMAYVFTYSFWIH